MSKRHNMWCNYVMLHYGFWLINIGLLLPNRPLERHRSDLATQEINDLPKVVDDAMRSNQGEGDFVVLGDLNADFQ